MVNPEEAETVRATSTGAMPKLGSILALKDELDAGTGIVSKRRVEPDMDARSGAKPLARGALYLMLQNRIYRGEIVHKDKSYPGEQRAIVEQDLWDRVQARLAENRVERRTGGRAKNPSLLVGLLHDDKGAPHDAQPCREERKTLPLLRHPRAHDPAQRGGARRPRRVPAGDIEQIVASRLRAFLLIRGGDP